MPPREHRAVPPRDLPARDLPPRGRAPRPPYRDDWDNREPYGDDRDRPARGGDWSDGDRFDDERPTGRASVRAPVGRAPVGQPTAKGGRHARRGIGQSAAAGGGNGLPPNLSLNRGLYARGRILPATIAILIIIMGVGVVTGTYMLDSVKLSSELTFPATTTVLYADGTELAKLGEVTRYEVPYEELSQPVLKAIVASEDESFWTNDGIDLGGVMRAAWNNFTGGDTQGASTITQQYARLAFDLDGVTYQRKVREAALAWKISKTLTKEEILGAYLNSVPFGRQAYGIEAAAGVFFGKTARTSAAPEQQLTWAEAVALVAMVKQPYPDPNDPEGHPGYDPTISPAAEANARQRFDYVRGQLVGLGELTQEQADALAFPMETFRPYTAPTNGLESPAGMVVNHVLSELTHSPDSPFYGAKDWTFIREGGYQIYTTLHPGAQRAATVAADAAEPGSPMEGQPENLQSALVAIQPGTGRVLAYYGGHDGKGADYAGFYYDEQGDATGVGRHPPGSSFKVYTLAAALKAGFSLKSYWEWNPHDMQGRTGANQIKNASTCGSLKAGDKTPCSLLQSTISSLNVPYYQVTLSVGPAKVLEMARDAGIDYMWTDDLERRDLREVADMSTESPTNFDTILGIGQYSVTVLDHANGLATMAAGGLRADAHFVQKVMKGTNVLYADRLPVDQGRILSPQNVNDLTFALSQVSSAKVNTGWDTAGKTGTWELASDPGENGHAWMVGFSRRIAAAVWVGNKADEQAIRDKGNSIIYGSGLPSAIWQSFMTNATAALNEPKENTKFNAPNYAGETMPPGAVKGPNEPGRDPRATSSPTRRR
jgi:membrane peptidoglycan carboxypeptidase